MIELNADDVKAYLETSEEGQAIVQSFSDRRVSQALSTYREKHPDSSEDASDLIKEKDATINDLKIEKHVILECHKRQIPLNFVTDMGIEFNDIADVDAKLERVSEQIERFKTEERNHVMGTEAFKPGMGNAPERVDPRQLSVERAIFLEGINELDGLLGES